MELVERNQPLSTELERLSKVQQLSPVALALPEGLTYDQWAEIGADLARVTEGVMWWLGDWWVYGERYEGDGRDRESTAGGTFSIQTVKNAGVVTRAFTPERRRDSLPWWAHAEVAALGPRQQDALLDSAGDEGWTRQQLRSAVRDTRRQTRVDAIVRDHAPGLDGLGPFPVLLADPPWRYDFALDSDTRAIENQYPTMTTEDIAALEVPAADDAVLFLWVTSPKLPEGLDVLAGWGFQYVTSAVWVKDRIGMGYYFRQQHELLLVATKGDLPPPAQSDRPPSVVTAARGEHSAKPEEVYTLIEGMYPDYLAAGLANPGGEMLCELFQRQPRKGWAGWGNEV